MKSLLVLLVGFSLVFNAQSGEPVKVKVVLPPQPPASDCRCVLGIILEDAWDILIFKWKWNHRA